MVGVGSVDQLNVQIFSNNALGLVCGTNVYCRSLESVVEGKGLKGTCYVEAGTILHLLKPGDIIAETRNALQDAASYLPRLQGAILFNCTLRWLELKAIKKVEAFHNLFKHLPYIGFNSFGEELFTHHNQTLTAIFFGRP
ncbi:hypothetical protein Holit_03386 [Hollandina sp. SP2]